MNLLRCRLPNRGAVITVLLVGTQLLAGCSADSDGAQLLADPSISSKDAQFLARIPSFQTNPEDKRRVVADPTGEKAGTIVVDTSSNFLYFVLPKDRAIRYGISTGAEAFGWTGVARVARKSEWPRWTPPASMVSRSPHLRPIVQAGGMKGGPDNPLGARALYLYQGDRDTLYRIHGTNEPDKIRLSVSSGCIRMLNLDVIDLYNRVGLNAKVIVR